MAEDPEVRHQEQSGLPALRSVACDTAENRFMESVAATARGVDALYRSWNMQRRSFLLLVSVLPMLALSSASAPPPLTGPYKAAMFCRKL